MKIIKTTAFILAIVAFISFGCFCSYYRYNNGECRSCENGKLIFTNATRGKDSTDYIFTCDNCNRVYTFAINPTWFE